MSGESGLTDGLADSSADGEGTRRAARTGLGRLIFGDRIGLAIFLGAFCFGILFWRAGWFITDNLTLARTLEALSEGRVWIERVEGDSHFNAPGADVRDGKVYGRNYGQLVISLPALFVLQAIDHVADIRVALVAVLHLAALGCAVVVGDLFERRQLTIYAAVPVVSLLFVGNLFLATTATELTDDLPLAALQLTSVLVTALLGVAMYRLLRVQSVGVRTATLAGVATVFVLPVGFWAAIPKRHVFIALSCFLILGLVAISRQSRGRTLPVVGRVPVARAGAYATVGFVTWIHAGEGLFLFLALLAVDLPTAPRNDWRSLLFIGVVFALSMLPTVVTNLLVTGSPMAPPRSLAGSITDPATATVDADQSIAGNGGGSSNGGLVDSIADLLPLGVLGWFFSNVFGVIADSLRAATEPTRLYHTYIRSAGADLAGSRADFIGDTAFAGTNLSVLESAPVLALTGVVAAGWLAAVRKRPYNLRQLDPTAVLAGGFILVFMLIYTARLPLYSQITQRYILAIFPLALFLLARSPQIERLVEGSTSTICWSYALGVFIGGQLFIASVVARELQPGTAAQLNASISLVAAALLVLVTAAAFRTRRLDRPAAVMLGVAGAAGTVFIVSALLVYFSMTGEAVVPVVEELSRLL